MKKVIKIILGIIGVALVVLLVLAVVNYVRSNLVSSTGSGYDMVYDSAEMRMSYGASTGLGSSKSSSLKSAGFAENSSSKVKQNYQTTQENIIVDRLIIKTGSLSVVVSDVNETVKKISKYAEDNGGFVVSSDVSKRGDIPYGNITVRIPSNKFETGVTDVKGFGDVKSESVNGQDVTEEYVDLDAQIRNLRVTENQFLVIMQKADEIKDILAVQKELSNVRGNIERIEGRMKYLRTSADMSTLRVTLSTDPNVLPTFEETNKWKPLAVLKTSVRALIEVGKLIANAVIFLAIFIPVWLFVGLVVWLVIKLYKRNKRSKNQGDTQPNFRA